MPVRPGPDREATGVGDFRVTGPRKDFRLGQLLENGPNRPSLLPVLRVTAVVGTVWVAVIYLTAPQSFHNLAACVDLGLLALLWIVITTRVPEVVRFAIIEAVYFCISASAMMLYGAAPAVPVLLALFILLATIHHGRAGGIIAGAASLLLIAGGAWGWTAGVLPIGARLPPLTPAHYDFWVRTEFAQLLAVCGIVGIVSYLGREMRALLLRLRVAEEKFSKAFRVSPDAMAITELDSGRVIEVNESHGRLTGYGRDEVVGRTAAELGALLGLPDPGSIMDVLRAGGTVSRVERRMRDRSGRAVELSCSAERFDFVGQKCALTILRDVTDQKRAEAALRESEERLRNFTEAAFEAIFVSEEGRIIDVNDQGLKLLGQERADVIGRQVVDFVSPESRELVAENIRYRRETAYQLLMQRKDGGVFHAEAQAKMMGAGSRTLRITAVREISERLRNEEKQRILEEQLRHTQKMDALGTLAGGIAHDFNNILTGILGNLQLAELDLAPGHPSLASLGASVQACRRARDLVARILSFSRLAQDNREAASLGPTVLEAVELLRFGLTGNVEIRTRIDGSCPAVVFDSGQMHQVVMNLGTNAIYAMRGNGGVLTIELDPVLPDRALRERHPQVTGNHTVRMTVRDTGCGMEPAVLKHLFEPFFTTKSGGNGTGLGLAMVHAIMKSHEGAVVVESAPGKGARFDLYFPAAAGPASQADAGWMGPVGGKFAPFGNGRRIMIIDDQEAVRGIGTALLERMGFVPMAFERAAEALDVFQVSHLEIAAVITDLTMPEMNGLELAGRIMAIRPGVPIIIASGYMSSEAQHEARALGVRTVIHKPYELEEMVARIRAIVDNPA